jgi:hypothetical protein
VNLYVFLVSRPTDKGHVWPAVYTDRDLAEKAFGRVSEIREVELDRSVPTAAALEIGDDQQGRARTTGFEGIELRVGAWLETPDGERYLQKFLRDTGQ